MKHSPIIIMALVVLAACSKNKNFPSTPQITLKSISGNVVPAGSALQVVFSFKDAEGDIQDTLFYWKTVEGDTIFHDSRQLPRDVPKKKNSEGEIIFTMDYISDIGAPQNNRPDTAIFSFYMKDLAGHISDTVSTPPIVILNN